MTCVLMCFDVFWCVLCFFCVSLDASVLTQTTGQGFECFRPVVFFSSFCTPFAIFLQISPWCVWGNSRASGTPQRSSTPSCETAAWTSCATTPASWEDWLKMNAELTGDGQTLFASFSLHICFYSFNLWYHNPKIIWCLLISFDIFWHWISWAEDLVMWPLKMVVTFSRPA
jgi:hypothetical protein